MYTAFLLRPFSSRRVNVGNFAGFSAILLHFILCGVNLVKSIISAILRCRYSVGFEIIVKLQSVQFIDLIERS